VELDSSVPTAKKEKKIILIYLGSEKSRVETPAKDSNSSQGTKVNSS
jgi:hypothetical protein